MSSPAALDENIVNGGKTMSSPATLNENIKAYEAVQAEMEQHHMHKYVVFYNCQFIDAFDDFNNAMEDAAARYGRGPYLIREVGGGPIRLPASLTYRLADV